MQHLTEVGTLERKRTFEINGQRWKCTNTWTLRKRICGCGLDGTISAQGPGTALFERSKEDLNETKEKNCGVLEWNSRPYA
jgi:hypothetical protein